MLSYETLDKIADSYNPVLAFITIGFIGMALFKKQWRLFLTRLLSFIAIVLVAYGLMFLDVSKNIWGAVGLDYSTHTAVAIGFVAFLVINASSRKISAVWIFSFLSYALLMRYQRYHTFADIVTTALAVSMPLIPALLYLSRNNDLQVTYHKN